MSSPRRGIDSLGAANSGDGESQNHRMMPMAPYPPSVSTSHHRGPLPSALVSSAHYSRNKFENNVVASQRSGRRRCLQLISEDFFAATNCRINSSEEDLRQSKPKQGPTLLEIYTLSRLDNKESFPSPEVDTSRPLAVARGNPSYGTSVASTCMDVAIQSRANGSVIAAVTGLDTGAFCVHVQPLQDIEITSNWKTDHFTAPKHQHRPSTSIAWRPQNDHMIALGLTSKRDRLAVGPTRGGSAVGGGGLSNDQFGCLIWDIRHKRSPPNKFCHQMGIASLEWMDSNMLVVGSEIGHLQIYDLRLSARGGASSSASTTMLNHMDVHVVYNRQNDFQLATVQGSVIKFWDTRRLDSSHSSDIKLGSPAVKACWSSSSSIVVAADKVLHEYDTQTSRPVMINSVWTNFTVDDILLLPSPSTDASIEPKPFRRRRALISVSVAEEGQNQKSSVRNVPVQSVAPIAYSPLSGAIVNATESALTVGLPRLCEDDISEVLKSRCSNKSGAYSMDCLQNFALFRNASYSEETEALLRLWTWVHRVESLMENEDLMHANLVPKSLVEAGAIRLLTEANVDAKDPEKETLSSVLGCIVYESSNRRFVYRSNGVSTSLLFLTSSSLIS